MEFPIYRFCSTRLYDYLLLFLLFIDIPVTGHFSTLLRIITVLNQNIGCLFYNTDVVMSDIMICKLLLLFYFFLSAKIF